jgi:hypothetical protein
MFDAAQGEVLHVNSTAAVSDSRPWTHPKITPFRLAFMFTTGGLGIAKAALVSNGKTASSTTVEWITGVVVALMWVILRVSCDYEADTMLSGCCNTVPAFSSWALANTATHALNIWTIYFAMTVSDARVQQTRSRILFSLQAN